MTRYIAIALGAGLLAVAGCGDDKKASDATSTTAEASVEIVTKQVVRSNTPGKKPTKAQRERKPTNSAAASKGDVVQLVTQVPKQELASGAVLTIEVAKGPASDLKTSAGGLTGDRSTATIRARSGQIKLGKLRYACTVAPDPTYCPVEVKETEEGWELRMKPSTTPLPVVLTMIVG